jgi:hypothetical protein
MDKVVQQNAAAVQESAAAAEGMRQQAEALVQAVSAFRLTLDERVGESAFASRPADLRAALTETAPAATTRALPPAPVKPRKAAAQPAAATVGDDWEEF